VIALVLLVAGCRHDASEESVALDTSPLTSAELGWVRAYSAWAIDISDDEVTPLSGKGRVASCEDDVEKVGPAPTARLEAATRVLADICPLLASDGTRRRALDLVEEADDLVYRYLLDDQPLALATGESADSHASVELSERATQWLDEAVEVRCWADEDWARIVREDDAWNDDSTDPDELVGYSDDFLERIHLVLDFCNTISRVVATDVDAFGRDEKIEFANALETLLHEMQHIAFPEDDEAAVECRAIRSLERFARRFGLSSELGRELTQLYRTEIYPDLDDEYTRGGCPP
jgi:hypothetical protein